MVTTVSRTIGATGYYSTIPAWFAACPANLVTADQIWEGQILWASSADEITSSGALLNMTGITTDATRFIRLTAAPGASFADNANKLTNALRYNASNGAALRKTGNYGYLIATDCAYTEFTRLQFSANHTADVIQAINTAGVKVDRCIIESGLYFSGVHALLMDSNATVVSNTLVHLSTTHSATSDLMAIRFRTGGGLNTILNCTIVRASDGATPSAGMAFRSQYGVTIAKNTVAFGFLTFCDTLTTGADYNASDVSVAVGSHNLTSLTYTSQFENTTGASADYRLKAGSALIDAGTGLSGSGITTDIVGTARGATYDIGAWEYATALADITGTSTLTLAALTGSTAGTLAIAAATAATLAGSASATARMTTAGASTASLALAAATSAGAIRTAGTSAAVLGLSGATLGALALSATSVLSLSITGLAAGVNPYVAFVYHVPASRTVTLAARLWAASLASRGEPVVLAPRRRTYLLPPERT